MVYIRQEREFYNFNAKLLILLSNRPFFMQNETSHSEV